MSTNTLINENADLKRWVDISALGVSVYLLTGQVKNTDKNTVIIPGITNTGGLYIYLPRNLGHPVGGRRTCTVASLVLWAGVEAGLVEKPERNQVAFHLDGDYTNHGLYNLCWATRSEIRRALILRETLQTKLLHHVNDVRLFIDAGYDLRAIADAYGVHPGTIYMIKANKNWNWIPRSESQTVDELRLAKVRRFQVKWMLFDTSLEEQTLIEATA